LVNQPTLSLQARKGYYAPRKPPKANDEAKEEIQEALFSQEEMHDLPVDLQTQFSKSTDVDAKLSALIHVDVKRLHYQRTEGRNNNELTIATALFDHNGRFISGNKKILTMHWTDETLEHKLDSGITMKTGFDVKPGSYLVRLVVRDAEGLISAENAAVEIPAVETGVSQQSSQGGTELTGNQASKREAVLSQNVAPPQLKSRPVLPLKEPPGGTPRQITLDVQVTDRHGAPVHGLQQQDFTLLDDNQPQTILSLYDAESGSTSDSPVEIIVVVDAFNASYQTVNYERQELKKFLLRDKGQLAEPLSLVVFSGGGTKVQNGSSRDGNALAALYDQYESGLRSIPRSQGFYGATERFYGSLKTLISLVAYEKTRPGRKLMVWISPGWPMLTDARLSRGDKEQLFNWIVDTSTDLRQARVTLYSIDALGMSDAGGMRMGYYQQLLKPITSSSQAIAGDLALQVLAVQSGGRVFSGTNDLEGELAKCVADAAAFYMLSFNASRADKPDQYHSVSVSVDKPGSTVRTRTGYYAQP
jgi:VWFA-related protein